MAPLLFLLVVNAVNFGAFIFFWITIADATRAIADSVSFGTLSVGSPTPPNDTTIRSILSNAGANADYCLNTNSTTSPIPATCPFPVDAVPGDPEGGTYTLLAVDVSYTYTPIIPSFSIPTLGIYSTLPPTAIKRRAITRMLN